MSCRFVPGGQLGPFFFHLLWPSSLVPIQILSFSHLLCTPMFIPLHVLPSIPLLPCSILFPPALAISPMRTMPGVRATVLPAGTTTTSRRQPFPAIGPNRSLAITCSWIYLFTLRWLLTKYILPLNVSAAVVDSPCRWHAPPRHPSLQHPHPAAPPSGLQLICTAAGHRYIYFPIGGSTIIALYSFHYDIVSIVATQYSVRVVD